MAVFYRCKSCAGDHPSTMIAFQDRNSFDSAVLENNSWPCPKTGKVFAYGKQDMFWKEEGSVVPPVGEFNERIFEDQVVVLDGNSFSGCTFRRCTLQFSAASLTSLRANRLEDVRFAFEGGAALTLGFLSAMYRDNPGFHQLLEATFEDIRRGIYSGES